MKASKMYSLINEDKDSENIINAIRTFVRECDDMTKLKSASPSAFVKSILWMSRYFLEKGKEKTIRSNFINRRQCRKLRERTLPAS